MQEVDIVLHNKPSAAAVVEVELEVPARIHRERITNITLLPTHNSRPPPPLLGWHLDLIKKPLRTRRPPR